MYWPLFAAVFPSFEFPYCRVHEARSYPWVVLASSAPQKKTKPWRL